MKKKKWLIPVAIIGISIVLWFTGIIPKQIANISGTSYVNKHFPEMQLECVGVEYADVYGDYLITFKGTNEFWQRLPILCLTYSNVKNKKGIRMEYNG